jgi:hypothetical protein
MERVHCIIKLDAGQAEHRANALPVKRLHQGLTAGHFRHIGFSKKVVFEGAMRQGCAWPESGAIRLERP